MADAAPPPAASPGVSKIPKKAKKEQPPPPPVALTEGSVKAATSAAIREDAALREAAQTGTLTLKMVRKSVVRRLDLGDEGGTTLKKEYKEIMKAEMLATASSLQVKEEEAAPAPVQSKPKLKPKPKPKPKKRVIVEESEGEEEEEEEEEEILDDAEIARRERAPHKDDPKFEKVDPAWKAQYADVAWVASQGFEHWPSIIYDPRWTKGNINAAGMRYLGNKHVCLFYAMDASERFAYEPLASIVPWEEGLRRGYDKKASNFKPKKYEKAFPKALAEATEEHAKDKEHRSFRDAHDTSKKKPPAKKKKVSRRDDDDFISKEDSDDDMAALRAKTKSAPKARKEPVAKKPRTDDEKRRALEALATKKRQRDEAAQKDKPDRERRMKDAARSGVPVWKQLSDRPGDKAAPKSPPKAAAPVQLPNDARGLVEALKRATVGGEKSAKVTRVAMAKLYREKIPEIVGDDVLLRDLVAVIRGALSEGQDEKIAEALKRLKNALKEEHRRDKAAPTPAPAPAAPAAAAPAPAAAPSPAPEAAAPAPSAAAPEVPAAPPSAPPAAAPKPAAPPAAPKPEEAAAPAPAAPKPEEPAAPAPAAAPETASAPPAAPTPAAVTAPPEGFKPKKRPLEEGEKKKEKKKKKKAADPLADAFAR